MSRSAHLSGRAVDIAISGDKAHRLVRMALLLGFTGIGVRQRGDHRRRFVHLDDLDNAAGRSQAGDLELLTTRTGRGPGRNKSIRKQTHTRKGINMLRVLLCFLLLASWPGRAASGTAAGSPVEPASPRNQAPQTVSYIDVGILYVGGSSATVNASSYFSDPDEDTLTYSVNSPSPTIATVSISGSTVTITPVAVGNTSKIVVTARDPGGLTATQDFNVTVQNPPPPPPPNRAPVAVGFITNVTLQEGGSSATRSVSGKFSDPDKDTLTYTVNSPNPSIVTVSISGSTVTITPVAAGTTGKIVVTARDPGGLTATQDFTATVEDPPPPPPPNRAPVAVGSITSVTVQEGGASATRSVSGNFSDPDGDTLTYTVNSPNPSIVTVSISGSTVTITPVAAGTTGKIVVTARDPGGLTATQDFTATVEDPPPPPPVNRAPTTVGYITDVTLSNRGSSATRSVSGNFSDPDGDTLTYTVNSPNPSIATVSISGSTVTVAPVAIGNTGKIVVTATDPDGLTATQDFTATVVNNPPRRVGSIANFTLFKNGKTRSIPVSGKFSDPNGDTLTYSASSSRTSVATASVSGSSVTVRSRAKGTATITVTATDPYDASVTQTFTVKVLNRHPQPQGTIAKMEFHRGEGAKRTDVSDNFRDPDNDVLTFTASSSDTSVARASVTGSNVEVRPGALGTARITVTATDTDNAKNRHGFDVEVVNGPPKVKLAIPDKRINKKSSESINATNHFSDPEGDSMTFSASSSNTKIVTASASGSTVTINSKAVVGSANITVTATDSHNGSVSDTLTVTVRNRPPQVVDSFAEVNIIVGGPPASFDVSGIFSDPDNDKLTFSVDDPDTSIAAVSISGSEVTVEPRSEGTIGKVTVTATDTEEDSISEDFRVVVGPASTASTCPTANTVDITVPDMIAGGDAVKIDVSAYFTIPEGGTATYSVNDPNPHVATFSVTGDTLTIQPKNKGDIGNVNVVAGATGCTDASRAFEVKVKPPPDPPTSTCPTANTVDITVPDMIAGGDAVKIDVSAYFTIPEGGTATYSVNDPNPHVATFSVTGDTLTIQPKNKGDIGNVNVTAGATGCTDVSRAFEVKVKPAEDPPTPTCQTANTVPVEVPAMCAGGDPVQLDVSDYFTIPEGVTATYSVNDPSPQVATFSISGNTLTIDPKTQGQTGKVIITASATDCTDVTRDFNVIVSPAPAASECPAVKQTHPSRDLSLIVGASAFEVNLSDHFTNLDASDITYSIESSNSGVAEASRTGATLAISPGTAGAARVTVTVSRCGCGTGASQVFNVRVEPPATRCPAADLTNPIPDQTLTVSGNTKVIDVSGHFTNTDGVTYEVSSSNTSVATVSNTGASLSITPEGEGTATVTVTVSKDGCTNVEQSITVTVTPCPSISASIPAQNLVVGGNSAMISLSSYFDDLSGSKITATSSDGMIASASLLGTELTIEPEGEGSATVTVSVSKDGCTGVEQSISVTVSPCPLLRSAIEDQALSIGNDPLEIDLTEYFAIPAGFEPGFTISSSDGEVATEGLEGNILTVTPVASGTDTITVTATKMGCDGSVVDEFVVTVLQRCPAVITGAPIPDLALFAGAGVTRINLTGHFENLDLDGIEISATSPGPETAAVSIEDHVLKIDPKTAGQIDIVTVTVTDTAESDPCEAVSLFFRINVFDPVSAPWSESGENVYLLEGNVGIGVSSPDQKLVVDGKIRAEEVYVSMTPADYVFEADYDLMPLEDVARHIRGPRPPAGRGIRRGDEGQRHRYQPHADAAAGEDRGAFATRVRPARATPRTGPEHRLAAAPDRAAERAHQSGWTIAWKGWSDRGGPETRGPVRIALTQCPFTSERINSCSGMLLTITMLAALIIPKAYGGAPVCGRVRRGGPPTRPRRRWRPSRRST